LAGIFPQNFVLGGPPSTPTSRLIRSFLKAVLSNSESRKIFYFLMLNMCYMLVQMLYGMWTNSLGLISDGELLSTHTCFIHIHELIAIHMAFDCMAIGVGLFASVMATWSRNERFTYGCVCAFHNDPVLIPPFFTASYGRIETLSGFANGVFLILISIFIVFEAIQRL
jgi:zinc transporter 5/7